ncbi:MAG: quinol oxidase [Deltaproteobacteria bacterium RBG_16_54_18]|nr:MAG: quinol oxidase [Deltaproteobacteria bacterium RBG_16_54_18]
MKYKKLLFVIVAVVGALFLTAAAQETVTVVPVDKDGVQRVDMVGGGYFFKPNHIVVKVNVPVELKVTKESGFSLIPHDIAAKSPEAGIVFQESLSSTPKIIKFTPTQVGKYPLYCSKKAPFSKSHREKGMEGVIEVVP